MSVNQPYLSMRQPEGEIKLHDEVNASGNTTAVSYERLWEEPFMWLWDSRGKRPLRFVWPINRITEHLLKRYTSCPLIYNWTDLGLRYFPRWFRLSRCLERPTCSVPAGMVCQPAAREEKTLLNYFCAARPSNPKSPCRWIHRNFNVCFSLSSIVWVKVYLWENESIRKFIRTTACVPIKTN